MRGWKVAVLCVALYSCSAAVARDINSAISLSLPVEECVAMAVEGGNDNAVEIAASCGGIAVSAVFQIISSFLAIGPASPDAGGTTDATARRYHQFLSRNAVL
jgi:hypothetical protein